MTPQFSKEDKKIVTDFIAKFNKIFSVNKNVDSSNYHWSEKYVWNKFTIQVRALGDYKLECVTVEIYFDSERLDYKNKMVKFKKGEEDLALEFAKKIYRENTDDLLIDAVSCAD